MNKWGKFFIYCVVVVAGIYAATRLYYEITGGFTLDNIHYDYVPKSRWEMAVLPESKKNEIDKILSQKFSYFGKGCQSYVFMSEDGQYMLKFFKYQRFRPQPWLYALAFLPGMQDYLNAKVIKKSHKLERVFDSWKLAFEQLQNESGLVYVHLNKHHEFKNPLLIFDKMGFQHTIDLNQTEFLIQKKADMLCSVIDQMMHENRLHDAEMLLTNIVNMIISEYHRGLADLDHALMQNTGVRNSMPLHIDVGQFTYYPQVKNPEVYKQELFSKTYRFRNWLQDRHPPLADYLENELRQVIGLQFDSMQPYFKPHE